MSLMRWCLLALALVALPAHAEEHQAVKRTAKAAGHTAATAAVDAGRTAGHTVKSFFHGGLPEAKQTAKAHGKRTATHAKAGALETKRAADGL